MDTNATKEHRLRHVTFQGLQLPRRSVETRKVPAGQRDCVLKTDRKVAQSLAQSLSELIDESCECKCSNSPWPGSFAARRTF